MKKIFVICTLLMPLFAFGNGLSDGVWALASIEKEVYDGNTKLKSETISIEAVKKQDVEIKLPISIFINGEWGSFDYALKHADGYLEVYYEKFQFVVNSNELKITGEDGVEISIPLKEEGGKIFLQFLKQEDLEGVGYTVKYKCAYLKGE